MRATPVRLISALLWPLTIWTSLGHFEEHSADDYVERTSPIVASAIAFWVCAIALVIFANPAVTAIGGFAEEQEVMQFVRRTPGAVVSVLWVFTPVIYAIGLFLFAARDESYPR
jgi:hypothetical protein